MGMLIWKNLDIARFFIYHLPVEIKKLNIIIKKKSWTIYIPLGKHKGGIKKIGENKAYIVDIEST